MIKKLLLISILISLVACGSEYQPEYKGVRTCPTDKSVIADFIVRCATAANPHSDEEGEDLVAQCEETAEHTFCEYKEVQIMCNSNGCIDPETKKVTSRY
jgi:hypothetical protein